MNSGNNKLGNNGGRFYSYLNKPVLIECSFVVDSTNGNGLGIRSLKGQGVSSVFMNSSAAFTGTSHTSTLVDSISPITTGVLVAGMPVQGSGIPVGTKIASVVSSTSILLTKATTSSTTGSITYQGLGGSGYPSPNPAAGYALVQLSNNYNKYLGGFSGLVSPLTGGTVAINSTSLTPGNPYVIVSVGHGAAGTVTIAPVADVSGSLASTWFSLYDGYGNTFIIWFSVSGVGSAPVGVSGTLVQQSISTNDTAATIGADLVVTIEHLLAATPQNPGGPSGVFSFTASGTTTVTVVSTLNQPLPGTPADGTIATGFTFATTVSNSNLENWQAVGLPQGIVPNVGASFIATTSGQSTGGGSTGLVKAVGVSGIQCIEVIGDANQSFAPSPQGGTPNVGGWVLVQFLAPTVSGSAYDTPMIPTAPAPSSVVGMSFYVEAGAGIIAGD